MTAALDDIKCDSCGEPATHRRRTVDSYCSGEIEYIPYCDECDPPKKVNPDNPNSWAPSGPIQPLGG